MWGRMVAGAVLILATGAFAETDGFTEDFGSLDAAWYVAHYDFDHPYFDTDWRREQVVLDEGLILNLTARTSASKSEHPDNRFIGASVRRHETSHYGRYEVEMQAARGAGVVTGFFTYTGPYYGTRHDEIDIEFLGKDTTQMHVAWFVDGQLTNHFIELPFDAADGVHHYAFEWWPDRLRWFADGALIFEHLAQNGEIPRVPSRLFANIWAADPSIANWAGQTQPGIDRRAVVKKIKFAPFSEADLTPQS